MYRNIITLGRKGIAAVEFALLAPLLATITVGTLETVLFVRADMLMNYTTSQAAHIIASYDGSKLNLAGVMDVCNGAKLIMHAYDTSKLSMAIISAHNDPIKGKVTLWEVDNTCGTVAAHIGATPPAAALGLLTAPNANLIYVQGAFTYVPMFPQIIGNINMHYAAPAQPLYYPAIGGQSSGSRLLCGDCPPP